MKPGIRKTMAPKPAARGGAGARGKAAASGAKGRGAGAGASGSGGGDAGRMVQVRVIEDGFDLTPLPLLLSTRAETPSLAVAQAEELASSVDSPSEGSEASEGDLEASLEDSEDEFEGAFAKTETTRVLGSCKATGAARTDHAPQRERRRAARARPGARDAHL